MAARGCGAFPKKPGWSIAEAPRPSGGAHRLPFPCDMKRISLRLATSAASLALLASASVALPALQQRSAPSTRRAASPVARPAVVATRPTSALALASDLGTMVDSKVRSGRWGLMVVSLTRGDTLYSVNPDELLQPASTMKLYTAALALDRFGTDHHFSTDVLRDGTLGGDGVVQG